MPSDAGLVPLRPSRAGREYVERPEPGLSTFALEIDYSGGWVDLNDTLNFKAGAETMSSAQVSWRKISVDSPIAEGSYIVHAVKAMVTEPLQIYVHGGSQQETQENIARLEYLFGRLDYRVRLTLDSYREYWRCQTADWTVTRSQVMTHNRMATVDIQVPRFPTVTRELVV